MSKLREIEELAKIVEDLGISVFQEPKMITAAICLSYIAKNTTDIINLAK